MDLLRLLVPVAQSPQRAGGVVSELAHELFVYVPPGGVDQFVKQDFQTLLVPQAG